MTAFRPNISGRSSYTNGASPVADPVAKLLRIGLTADDLKAI